MKLWVENKKKQIAYIAVFAVCLSLLAWIWVPRITEEQTVVDSALIADSLNLNGAAPSEGSQSLLPFGENLNTAVLDDARFRALIAPNALLLDPLELGRDNPFAPPEANPLTATSTASTAGVGR